MVLRSALIVAFLAAASSAFAQERVQVVTTTTDLRSLADAVGGDRIAAVSLVPPGLDAEEYQPKPQDALRLKQAQLLVRVGLDYDLWVDRLLAQVGRDLVARRDMRAGAGAIERPVMVRAAQPAVGDLPDRQIRTKMRAPGALHHRLARRVAPGDDPRAEEIAADQRAGSEIGREAHRIPGAVETRLGDGVMLFRQLGLSARENHGEMVTLPSSLRQSRGWHR